MMWKLLAAGLVGVGFVAFASSFAGNGQTAAAEELVADELLVVSPGVALDAETRGALEKIAAGMKEEIARLQQEKKMDAADRKFQSLRALNSFLSPVLHGPIVVRSEGTPDVAANRGATRDSSAPLDDPSARQIAVARAEAALRRAEENVEMQKVQNENDVVAAIARLDLAQLDLEKYSAGDSVYEINLIESELNLAKEELTRAVEKLTATAAAAEKVADGEKTVETERINAKKAEIKVAIAQHKLKVFNEYSHKRQLTVLKHDVAAQQRQLRLAQLTAQIHLTRAQREFNLARLEYETTKARLSPAQK